MDIEIRQATYNDRKGIAILLEKGFGNRYYYPERWNWLNLINPFIPEHFGIPEWIAILDGKVIGHTGAMLVPLKIANSTVTAGWSVDTLVTTDARGLGIGKKLQEANQSAHSVFMSLEMTAINRAIKKKLGAIEGPVMSVLYRTNYVLPLPVLVEIVRAIKLRFGINDTLLIYALRFTGILKAFCWGINKRIQRIQGQLKRVVENYYLESISKFDERADALWTAARPQFAFSVERTSEYLNWKYFKQPRMIHQCFYVKENKSVKGVLVMRKGAIPEEHNIGVICECYMSDHDPKKYEWLIEKATVLLIDQGAAGIWIATTDKELEEIVKSKGFMKIRDTKLMIHFKDGIRENVDNDTDIFDRSLIGKGDHDGDQFPNLLQPTLRQFVDLAFKRER